MKKTMVLLVISLGFCGFSAGCQGSNKPLKLTQCQPQGETVTLTEGQSQVFSCTVESRDEAGTGLHYQWTRSGDAAGNGAEYTFFGCGSATYQVNLTVTNNQGDSITRDWEVTLNPGSGAREACFSSSLAAVHHGDFRVGYPGSTTDEVTLLDIQDCLSRSLTANVCSVEGNYALALVGMALALRDLVSGGGSGVSLTPELVGNILDTTVASIRNQLAYVQEFAPDNFNFFIENNFLIHLLDDDPDTTDNESITMNFFGSHDLTEVNVLVGVMQMITGGISMALSFNGMLNMSLPSMSFSSNAIFGTRGLMDSAIKELIQKMIADPEYLNLSGPNGETGKTRLLQAQAAIVAGLGAYKAGFTNLINETSNQSWHLLRYWDCGKDGVCPPDISKFPNGDPYEPFEDCGADGICPGDGNYTAPDTDGTEGNGKYDRGEPYQDLNLNGRWNDSWAKVGPDSGEGNGKFDSGEPIGTEMILEQGRLSFGSNLVMMMNVLDVFSKNIEGPDALLFSSVIPGGGMSETQIKAFLTTFGIPYPEIRLSQFFENPTSLRRMVPWYDTDTLSFIEDSECEPFSDWGYDWTPDPLESGYDADKNPDPAHDDFNPLANRNDKIDNDRDGKIDESSSLGMPADFGPEGDFMFDWIDANANRRHDAGETSEKFDDVGVGPDHQGAGNGAWDCFDREHTYPTGPHVGGEPTEVTLDPLNTNTQDTAGLSNTSSTLAYMKDACVDPYYFFFPDPTFSGVLTFPEAISNKDGAALTKNAKLFRFFSKGINALIEMDILQVGIYQ
ncbi:MAG: hypothetical protein PHE84_06440 [bacterium]|nr:hypothetical protein [bacterium]